MVIQTVCIIHLFLLCNDLFCRKNMFSCGIASIFQILNHNLTDLPTAFGLMAQNRKRHIYYLKLCHGKYLHLTPFQNQSLQYNKWTILRRVPLKVWHEFDYKMKVVAWCYLEV